MTLCHHVYETTGQKICPTCGSHTHETDWKEQAALAKQWLKDFALATTKEILGEARSKFASIAGPGQAIQLNGAALKAEGQALLDKLDQEISLYQDGGAPLTWITG